MKTRFPCTLNRNSNQARGLLFWGPGGNGSYNLADLSGNGHEGNLQLGTMPAVGRWAAGVDGAKSAVTFDGSTNVVGLRNTTSLPITNALSLSLWVKTTKTGYNYLMVKWGASNGTDAFHLRIDATTGFVYWTISTTGSYQAANDLNGTSNCADGKWHHIVVTYDGAISSIYVDGKFQASKAITGNIASASSSSVFMGGLSDFSNTGNNLQGTIDDPRVYNYALPYAVIKEMYAPSTRWKLGFRPKNLRPASVTAAVVYNRSVTSTATFSQVASATNIFNRSASNTLAFTQTVVVRGPIHVSASNALSFAQSDLAVGPKHGSAESTIAFVSVAHGLDPTQRVSNTLSFVGAATKVQSIAKSVTQTLLFLSVADSTVLKIASSTVTFVSSATVEQTKGVLNALSFSQTATVKLDPHNEHVPQFIVFDHSAVGHITRSFTLTSTLAFTNAASVQRWRYASAFNVLPITQVAQPIKLLNPVSIINFTQTAVGNVVHNRRVFSNLGFAQTATRNVDYHRSAINTLVFNEHFHQIRDQSGGYITQPIVIGIVVPRVVILQIPGLAITLPRPLLGDAEGGLNTISILRTETDETYTYVRRTTARSLKYKFSISRGKALEMRNFVRQALASKITMTNWKGELWYGNLMNNPFEFTGQGRTSPCGEVWEIDFDFEGIRLN